MKVKQLVFCISFIAFAINLNAQTGIGTTTPHASAKLDVSATNKGFLPPRVALTSVTDATTIPSPAEGLLVFCTGASNLTSGYYYWNGSAWATIATAGGSGSFAASFLRGSRTATQSISAGSVVAFSNIENNAGNDISLNTANGKITLAPGQTYRLRAAVPNFAGLRPAFMWYNETSSAYIGAALSAYNPGDAAGNGASGGIAEVIITPTVSTVVSFRLLSANSTVVVGGNADFNLAGSYPWFDIEVISGNAPVTNEKTASGFVGRGEDITLGNLKVRFSATGNMSLQVSTVSGTYSVYGSFVKIASSIGYNSIDASSPLSITTTPAFLNTVNNFSGSGDTGVWTIMDTSKKASWRISMIIGASYNNNFISIERLF